MTADNTETTGIRVSARLVFRRASTFVIEKSRTSLFLWRRSSLDDGFGRGVFTRERSFGDGAFRGASEFSEESSRLTLEVGVHEGGSLAGNDSSDDSSTMSFLIGMTRSSPMRRHRDGTKRFPVIRT